MHHHPDRDDSAYSADTTKAKAHGVRAASLFARLGQRLLHGWRRGRSVAAVATATATAPTTTTAPLTEDAKSTQATKTTKAAKTAKATVGAVLLATGAMALSGCGKEVQVASTPSLAEVVYEVSTIHPDFKNRERSFILSGRVSAYTRADVRPQVDGIILNRLFEEGAEIEEGTPLYEIDPAPFKASVEHAQASYERAIVQRKMAYKDYERFASLYKRRSASEKERDDALLAYELAVADEKLYKAALDTAQISLNYTTVRAPVSGIIGISQVTRGALVNANQSTALATIIDLDKVYVDMEQSALEWRKLREGLLEGTIYLSDRAYDVTLYFEDGSVYSRLGVLSLSEVIVDENSGSISMRAIFDNPDHLLLPGMAVVCKISGGVSQNIMTLPANAVMRDPKGRAYVFTIQGDRVLQTSVTLGELYDDGWQILDGLDSSYEVVIQGTAALHHGSKIRITKRDGIAVQPSESTATATATAAGSNTTPTGTNTVPSTGSSTVAVSANGSSSPRS